MNTSIVSKWMKRQNQKTGETGTSRKTVQTDKDKTGKQKKLIFRLKWQKLVKQPNCKKKINTQNRESNRVNLKNCVGVPKSIKLVRV